MEEDSRQQLIGQNKALAKKVEYLETVIETHHITKFEENMHRLKLNIRMGIKQLASEFQVMEHDPKNVERIEDLIDYMNHYVEELRRFTFQKKPQK